MVIKEWGFYQILSFLEYNNETDITIKRLIILPTEAISYQTHNHRDEVWIVKSGIGEFIHNDNTGVQIKEGDILIIKRQEPHRIINNSDKPIEILEIQHGSPNLESDIIRIEDKYGR